MKINWMKYNKFYFLVSLLVIGIGVISLIKWGMPIGVDFTGGSVIEYKIEKEVATESISEAIEALEVSVNSVQKTSDGSYLLKLESIQPDKEEEVQKRLESLSQGSVEELKFESVGPAVGPELVRKTAVAILISATSILLWVAYQFKSLKFGFSAVVAVFHDSLVLIGIFALLGHLFGAEVDFLFVTALLTTLSFSVHDTIVVYDRIREIRRKHGGEISTIANQALSETMRRSINNSLTIIFMLVALILLGGTSVRWFAVALLIGTISGTYSSPFVAVPLLVSWDAIISHLPKRFRRV